MEEKNPAVAPAGRADPLLRPLQLGRLTLRNRVMSTSHETALDEGGLPLPMFGGSACVSADTAGAAH